MATAESNNVLDHENEQVDTHLEIKSSEKMDVLRGNVIVHL